MTVVPQRPAAMDLAHRGNSPGRFNDPPLLRLRPLEA